MTRRAVEPTWLTASNARVRVKANEDMLPLTSVMCVAFLSPPSLVCIDDLNFVCAAGPGGQ